MADRYMYLPQIGLAWGLIWAASSVYDWAGGTMTGAGRICTLTQERHDVPMVDEDASLSLALMARPPRRTRVHGARFRLAVITPTAGRRAGYCPAC